MAKFKLEEVFGVSAKPVESYVLRDEVDTKFKDALASDKQIIVYGSSKQGKTALVSKHLDYEKNLLVSVNPKTTVLDIYQTMLTKAGVKVRTEVAEKRGSEAGVSLGSRVKALIPFIGGGEVEAKGDLKTTAEKDVTYEAIPINLEQPQQVADLLGKVAPTRRVIVENFHYLTDETQKQLAFDLRAYQELGVRFVILGVWREKNRMIQFNGDLLDRVIEIPVEPWTKLDFRRVAAAGERALNIGFSKEILDAAIDASFSSVGVFQELLKGICSVCSVRETQDTAVIIGDMGALTAAIGVKAKDYASRHQRALEAIAAGHASGGLKGDAPPLFLPYYLVRVILERGYEGIATGMSRSDLHESIRKIHHRSQDVRASDMSNLLYGLGNLQSAKSISPPIIDYDKQSRQLQVVDSTFYFFIKNADAKEVFDSIPNPLEQM